VLAQEILHVGVNVETRRELIFAAQFESLIGIHNPMIPLTADIVNVRRVAMVLLINVDLLLYKCFLLVLGLPIPLAAPAMRKPFISEPP
jgi:hypothetical protein